eukprot:782398-Rhodomonas_salina.2
MHGIVDFNHPDLEVETNIHPVTPCGRDVGDQMDAVVPRSMKHTQHSAALGPEPSCGEKMHPSMAGRDHSRKQSMGSGSLNRHQQQESVDHIVTDH